MRQEAQKDAVSAFDDFMDECMERDWAQDRGRLVGQLMPIGASAKPQHTCPATHSRNQAAPLLLQGANGTTFYGALISVSIYHSVSINLSHVTHVALSNDASNERIGWVMSKQLSD